MSASTTDTNLIAGLKAELNRQMTLAAEPLVQQAMKDIELAMRQRLASMLIAYLDRSFTMDRYGHDLRIVVKLEPDK